MIRFLSNNSLLLLSSAFLFVAISLASCAKGVEPSGEQQTGQAAFVINLNDGTQISIENNFDPIVVTGLFRSAGIDSADLENMLREGTAKCNDEKLQEQVIKLLAAEDSGV